MLYSSPLPPALPLQALACPARAPSFGVNVQVVAGVGMAMKAMGLFDPLPSPDIFGVGYCLKMRGPNTSTVPASVIDLQSFWNWANPTFVGPTIGGHPSLALEESITFWILSSQPEPTGRRLLHFGQKPRLDIHTHSIAPIRHRWPGRNSSLDGNSVSVELVTLSARLSVPEIGG